MKNHFKPNGLIISVSRKPNKDLRLHINSEYSRSNHKDRLYVDEKRFATDVEYFWKSIKTKKLKEVFVFFGEIDYYDDMTNVYETPIISMKRGKKKAVIEYDEHGSIPKDWDITLNAIFSDTTANTPIMEVVKAALGSHFTPALEKEFKKKLKPVLQKVNTSCSVETDWE